jgi:glycosyltransferase involved in cell wall biosynthesis
MRQDHPSFVGNLSPVEGRAYAIVSSFPPTPCGIATFSAALTGGLRAAGAAVQIVRLGEGGSTGPGTSSAERTLADADVVIVQHEYGLYDGPDGDAVVELLEGLARPSIVVAHTVLQHPTPHQRDVLERVARAADAVVVMTAAGRERLCGGFDVEPAKVSVIVHGAAVHGAAAPGPELAEHGTLLTWGLLGPGKGIEHAIDALALLRDVVPRPRYVIAGDTHPKVHALHGEAYRNMLMARADRSRVRAQVTFDPGYRTVGGVAELLEAASVVVLPYDSPDQVTSGVLVDAIAAGRPVVATAFPHAVELLGSGAGLVVPQGDPEALALALRRVLTEPELAAGMAAEARRLAPGLAWDAVARQYLALSDTILDRRTVLSG